MTDHPDPTALRDEGQRLVEAIDAATIMIEDGVRGMAKSDCDGGGFLERSDAREIAREVIEAVCPTLLTTIAALTEERDEAVKRANPVRCSGCGSADTDQDIVASRTIRPDLLSCCPERQPLNIDAWRTRAEAAEARAAAMEAALEEISGHAPVKTPPDYATSSDTGEAFDDGYSRGVWEMGQIADAALAPQAEAGEGV